VPEEDPLDVAARALRHRDRSAREVDERLARAGIDDERRTEALETLARLGYVDDDRYASTRAAALAARGWGDAGIRAHLEQEGVGAAAAEQALAALAPEQERAQAIARRDGTSARTARRLAAKGFSEDVVETVARDGAAGV
jgi:SOS response regulatory protein OraA/RecX